MKRVYLILTLFMTSFFFISINFVKADTISFVVDDQDIAYLSDEFYSLREQTITYCNNNDKYYIILYHKSKGYYYSYVFNKAEYKIYTSNINNTIFPRIYLSTSITYFRLSNNVLTQIGTYTNYDSNLYDSSYTNSFSYLPYLDTNIENFYSSSNSYNITYNDFSYSVSSGEHFPSLYEFYTLMNTSDEPAIDDKFSEDIEIMNNFYSTVFTKISDLATCFASNYIFLFIFGIFILIFVLELIRRYLL